MAGHPTDAVPLKRALLLLDFQDDFLNADGRLPVAGQQVGPVLAAARQAVIDARRRGDLVVAVGNEFKPNDHLGNFFRRYASISGSPGSRWTAELPLAGIPYFSKCKSSAFTNPLFGSWLQSHGIEILAIAGLQARACVAATARDAIARGLCVELLGDAIACVSDKSRARALSNLARRGAAILHQT